MSYYERNKDKILKQKREYYKKNKEKIAEQQRTYNNPEVLARKREKWLSKSVVCMCGVVLKASSLTKHMNTRKHNQAK